MSAVAFWIERVRLWVFWATWLGEIFIFSLVRFWIWWLKFRGKEDRVEAAKQAVVEFWTGRIIKRMECKVVVEGEENIPMEGPLVIMSNHQSMYDIPFLMAFMGRMVGFVAKKELFRIPGFSWWMVQLGSLSLDRSDPRSAGKLYTDAALKMREAGSALVLFPEGTRTRDPGGEMGTFKDGALRLPAAAEIPILPVSIDGTRFFSQPEMMRLTRNGGRVVRMRIGKPVIPRSDANARERKEFMAALRETIVGNYEAIRVDWPMVEEAEKDVATEGA